MRFHYCRIILIVRLWILSINVNFYLVKKEGIMKNVITALLVTGTLGVAGTAVADFSDVQFSFRGRWIGAHLANQSK